MKSKRRIEQQADKRAAKANRINRPGGKSKYALKAARGGSRYWLDMQPVFEIENRACAIRMEHARRAA